MPIHQVKNLVNKEVRALHKYQKGEIKPVRTNRPHLDDTLTGLLPGDIVILAGASGAGKTFELQTIRENVMDLDINPFGMDYVFLDYSFEMKLFNLVLRGLNKHIDKSKKDILLTEFTDEEAALAKRYIDTLRDDRYFIDETPCSPEVFAKQTREFLTEHADKERVFVAIDHMALFKNSTDGKKGAIDAAGEIINELKREFDNVIFLLLSQLNRGILGRIKDNDINAAPNRSDLYQSDTMFHLGDYVIVVQNPHRLGITQYLKVNPNQYGYLNEHMTEPKGASRKVSFHTLGKIFYHVLKVREGEVVFNDIFIESIDIQNRAMYEEETLEFVNEGELDDMDFDLDFDDNEIF